MIPVLLISLLIAWSFYRYIERLKQYRRDEQQEKKREAFRQLLDTLRKQTQRENENNR